MQCGVNQKDFYMQNKQYQRHGLKKKVGLKKRLKTKTIQIDSSNTPDHLDVTVQQIHAQNSHKGILGHKDHFIITLDGKVNPGRSEDAIGFNTDQTTLSVLVIGKDNFSTLQSAALKKLIVKLKDKYGMSLTIKNNTNIEKI